VGGWVGVQHMDGGTTQHVGGGKKMLGGGYNNVLCKSVRWYVHKNVCIQRYS
jgi:hypothetical protein